METSFSSISLSVLSASDISFIFFFCYATYHHGYSSSFDAQFTEELSDLGRRFAHSQFAAKFIVVLLEFGDGSFEPADVEKDAAIRFILSEDLESMHSCLFLF
jgi:hypothetical protein